MSTSSGRSWIRAVVRGRLRIVSTIAAGIAMAAVAVTASLASNHASPAAAAAPEPCSTSVSSLSIEQLIQEPSVSVTPNKGPSGTKAELHIWNFLPNQSVSAIFRVSGDPVVASGTVGANGEAYLTFTVPQGPNGVYWILVAQENRTCVHAAVHFEIGEVPPTAAPTSTPVPPSTPTPIPPTPVPATPTPQPAPPIAGSGSGPASLLLNPLVAAAGFFTMASGFSALAMSRTKRRSRS